MRSRHSLPCLFLLLFLSLLPSAYPAPSGDYLQDISGFFATVKKGQPKEAAEQLLSSNPEAASRVENKLSIENGLERMKDTLGELKDFNIIKEKKIGERIVYVLAFALYEKQPVRFEFIFYKPNDQWLFLNVNFGLQTVDDILAIGRLP